MPGGGGLGASFVYGRGGSRRGPGIVLRSAPTPRVTSVVARHPRLGVLPAGAFDIRPGLGDVSCGFTRRDHREEAIRA
eukprot:6144329-Alexandrium_andersonii.AAC.1